MKVSWQLCHQIMADQIWPSVLSMAKLRLAALTAGESVSLPTVSCSRDCAEDRPECTAPSQDHHLHPRCSFSV